MSYLLIILLGEKVIQHLIVSVAFLYDIGNIRSTVAVEYKILMLSGVIIAVLFIVSIWGIIKRKNWGLFLVSFLAIIDIVGEFIAQGTVLITINISILVAIILLILCYFEQRFFRLAKKQVGGDLKKIELNYP